MACAIVTPCRSFLSTDDQLLKKLFGNEQIRALNPVAFVNILEENE